MINYSFLYHMVHDHEYLKYLKKKKEKGSFTGRQITFGRRDENSIGGGRGEGGGGGLKSKRRKSESTFP